MNVQSEASKVTEQIANLAAYNHAIVQMGDGDNPFPTEMFQADIQPIIAAMLEHIAELEGLLRESAPYVSYAGQVCNYDKDERAVERILSRIDAALGISVDVANALKELAEIRRVYAAVEKMLGSGVDLEVAAIAEPIEGVAIRVLDRTFRTIMFSKTAATLHVALAKLVEEGGK